MIKASERQSKAEQTTAVAWGIINSEVDARETKTARLRKLREAKEAEDAAAAALEPPAPKKKPRARSGAKAAAARK